MQARRLQPDDARLALDAIQSIKRPEPDPSFGLPGMREFLSRDENVLVVASDHGGPAGYAIAYVLDRIDRDRSMVCLYEIEVAGTHRRRGVAGSMIAVLAGVCRELEAVKMWTVTNRSNEAAMGLYESTGAVMGPGGDDVVFVWSKETLQQGRL